MDCTGNSSRLLPLAERRGSAAEFSELVHPTSVAIELAPARANPCLRNVRRDKLNLPADDLFIGFHSPQSAKSNLLKRQR